MLKMKNRTELEAAYKSKTFNNLFPTADIRTAVKKVLNENMNILTTSYGVNGEGGFIAIISNSLSAKEGLDEYNELLNQYSLEPDDCEYDDIIGTFDAGDIHLELFVISDFNLLLLYVRKG